MPAESGETFADRIKLLIQRVGSATEIARLCGFSEGVVRSWRDGNTDPSRARCLTLARTLGISLVWLVAGEGAIQPDLELRNTDDQISSETVRQSRTQAHAGTGRDGNPVPTMDIQRLDTAMAILQSELELADSPLSLSENADLVASLYDLLGPGGTHMDTAAMVAFNRQLAERIRGDRNRLESATTAGRNTAA